MKIKELRNVLNYMSKEYDDYSVSHLDFHIENGYFIKDTINVDSFKIDEVLKSMILLDKVVNETELSGPDMLREFLYNATPEQLEEVRNEVRSECENHDEIIQKLREEVNLLRKEKDDLIAKNFYLDRKVDNYIKYFSWKKFDVKNFKDFPRENEKILIFRANHFFLATGHIDEYSVGCYKDYLHNTINYFEDGDMIYIVPKPIS